MRNLFITFLIFTAVTAQAVELDRIYIKPTLWEKIKICKISIPCYFRENLGTTITTITGTQTVSSALKTTTNDNFTALNAGKMEVSTTSVNSITTLSNLVTIGTITSGTWQGTAIDVARQGTGTTSPTSNQVMIGNGASGLKVIGSGTSGQFFTSGGDASAPSWTTSAIDESAAYDWTNHHTFTSAFFTIASTTNATSTNAYVSNDFRVDGGLGVGIATTTAGNAEINGDLLVNGTIRGIDIITSSSQKTNCGDNTDCTHSTSCPAGYNEVIGGGFKALDTSNAQSYESYRSASTTWTVSLGAGGIGNASDMEVYVICIKN